MTMAEISWSERERAWDRHHDWYAEGMRPLTEWICDAIARPGARLLDLCSGTGQPALALAERVGEGGRVVATDVSPGMVESLERRRRARGIDRLEVRRMDAGALEFPDQSFDGVSCACGLMLAAEPAAWVREILRVSAPEGRFAILVWAELDQNPFFSLAFRAIEQVLPPTAAPAGPGPFSLAAPSRLKQVLEAGGASDFSVERQSASFEFESFDHYWRVFTEMSDVIARLRQLPDSEQQRARKLLEQSAQPFVDSGKLRLGVSALCASGRRS